MTTIDVNELDAYIKNQWNNDLSDWDRQEEFFRDLSSTASRYGKYDPLEVGPFKLQVVWQEGGAWEGTERDYWNFVFKVEGSDQLFKIDSDYSSYDGCEWHGSVYECEAYVEPVTKYRALTSAR